MTFAFNILAQDKAALRIGVLGGSFDPAHHGHLYISMHAYKFLRLNYVVWLVTPGNPLKNGHSLSLQERVNVAKEITMRHHYVKIADSEKWWCSKYQGSYSIHTIKRLRTLWPNSHIFWLMGSDNLDSLHLWYRWSDIVKEVDVATFSRNTNRTLQRSRAVQAMGMHSIDEYSPRAWGRELLIERRIEQGIVSGYREGCEASGLFVVIRHCPISSTEVRNQESKINYSPNFE